MRKKLNWYKIAQYKENDILTVYHGFNDCAVAYTVLKFGLSGKDRAPRAYSYESNNNPKGLFVTGNFDIARRFDYCGIIIGFQTAYSELESPVWPGGTYTVQGQASEYWGQDWENERKQKQEENRKNIIENEDELKYNENAEFIRGSDRPELAYMLKSSTEQQALFTGDLNPEDLKVWYSNRLKNDRLITRGMEDYKEITVEEALKILEGESQYAEKRDVYDLYKSRQFFKPKEEFSPDVFAQRLGAVYKDYAGESPEEIKQSIKWLANDQNYITRMFWPKQQQKFIEWLKS